jgi:hypothetical protein
MQWCLGVYSSGSTWLFNAVRSVAAAAFPERTLLTSFVYKAASVPGPADERTVVIVKSHHTEAAAAQMLRDRAAVIWLSVRDPRDCVASMMRYNDLDFREALRTVEASAHYCGRFAADIRARVFRYEDGFIENAATLDRIGEELGANLSLSQRNQIHQDLRRPAIERFIAQLPAMPSAVREPATGHIYDQATHWHDHHANRSGEVGRWRHELTADQVAAIEGRLGGWMRRFGYDASAGGGATRPNPAYGLPDAAKLSLRQALAAFDRSAPLIVVMVSDAYTTLLDNWLCHIQALGLTRFLVVAADEALHGKLLRAGVAAARCDFDGSEGDFWLRRMQVWELVVRQGYDVIQADVDAVWLRDPLPFFASLDRLDFLCSQGTFHPKDVLQRWGFVLCTGLFRMKAGRPAEIFFGALLADPVLIRETDDQAVMNQVLARHGVAWEEAGVEYHLEDARNGQLRSYHGILTGTCHALGLRIGMLPHREFPRTEAAAPEAYVRHLLRPADDRDRIEALRAAGCWMLDTAPGRLASG